MSGKEGTCCPTDVPPVPIVPGESYEAKGEQITTEKGTKLYVVGKDKTTTGLLMTYDIFGYHPTTFEFCDLLSSTLNCVVIMPDFFKGSPWPRDPWPPADFGPLMEWIGKGGKWEHLKDMFQDAIAHMTSLGVPAKKIGGCGLCWGAKPMFAAHAEGLISVTMGLHPSFLAPEDVEPCTTPTCLFPTKDDPPYDEVQAVLAKKPFAAKNIWKRFEDVHHGFVGARGDWSDAAQKKRVEEALCTFEKFWKENI